MAQNQREGDSSPSLTRRIRKKGNSATLANPAESVGNGHASGRSKSWFSERGAVSHGWIGAFVTAAVPGRKQPGAARAAANSVHLLRDQVDVSRHVVYDAVHRVFAAVFACLHLHGPRTRIGSGRQAATLSGSGLSR